MEANSAADSKSICKYCVLYVCLLSKQDCCQMAGARIEIFICVHSDYLHQFSFIFRPKICAPFPILTTTE